jgi:hypothetical protein
MDFSLNPPRPESKERKSRVELRRSEVLPRLRLLLQVARRSENSLMLMAAPYLHQTFTAYYFLSSYTHNSLLFLNTTILSIY